MRALQASTEEARLTARMRVTGTGTLASVIGRRAPLKMHVRRLTEATRWTGYCK
jgi:hypothetical protein